MAVIHGSLSIWNVVVLAVWLLCLKCAAIDLSELDRLLGEAVLGALHDTPITVPDACWTMRIHQTQFEKSLRGEGYRHLSLNHLIKLGPVFMVHLSARLMWLTAKKHALDIVETVSVRKGA